MRLRTLLGILSAVFWFVAIISVALPVASVMIPGALAVTQNRPSTAQSSGGLALAIPTNFTLSYRGLLPLDGVYLDVTGFYSNGTVIFSMKTGPYNLNPGSTTVVDVSSKLPALPSPSSTTSPAVAQQELTNFEAALSNITIKATASANLGGLIPISANADFDVTHLFNSTGTSSLVP